MGDKPDEFLQITYTHDLMIFFSKCCINDDPENELLPITKNRDIYKLPFLRIKHKVLLT